MGRHAAFVDAVARNRPLMAKPEETRQIMDLDLAADLSGERGEPVALPRDR